MSAFRNWGGKAAVLFLPIALGACAQYAQYGMTSSLPPGQGPIAWDGAGQDPNLTPPRRQARTTSSSVAQSAADADDQLARTLVICSTCIKPAPVQAAAQRDNNRQDVASAANR